MNWLIFKSFSNFVLMKSERVVELLPYIHPFIYLFSIFYDRAFDRV